MANAIFADEDDAKGSKNKALAYIDLLQADNKSTESNREVTTASYINDEIGCFREETGTAIGQVAAIHKYVEKYFSDQEVEAK